MANMLNVSKKKQLARKLYTVIVSELAWLSVDGYVATLLLLTLTSI